MDRDRSPVLLLHGFMGCAEAWGEGLLEKLARHRRVFAVDLPGHGGSGLAPVEDGNSLPRVVRDLTTLLTDMDVERAVWAGYSMGGRLALGAAVLHPLSVDRLVLESTSPGLMFEEERTKRKLADDALASRLLSSGIEQFVDDWLERPLLETQRSLPKAVRARERQRRIGNSPQHLARVLQELGTGRQPSFWAELPKVEVPVMVLTGEHDPKFERIGNAMADRLRAVRRVTVAGAGHAVHLERPEDWLRSVTGFLGED